MATATAIRSAFLDFFAQRQHRRLPSSPLVPENDATLLFVNAGMVPFKDIFTGRRHAPGPRATSSQKCLRISGKHNDLEEVGRTARHHTFFEMLGNFSFGDYFKREAIEWSWSLMTDILGLPPERFVVTIFGGEGALQSDDEAASLWQQTTGMPSERILRCGAEDNFWQMGDTGPCGPCSELHYFLGDGPVDPHSFGSEPSPDGRGWVELWNLVFMQYDRGAEGSLQELPKPSIDTGAGLERLAAVLQGVTSNYDSDLLRPLVETAAAIAGKHYSGTMAEDDVSMRVIADHARAAAFLLAEGVFPDRDGRSYVLRRVMRRAIRHGHRLGIDEPFLHHVTARVVQDMGTAYPELEERKALIVELCEQEEQRFRQTLCKGLELIDANDDWEPPSELGKERGIPRKLPGKVAFKLYDTYGFPLDLQQVIGEEQGFEVDSMQFGVELQGARQRSRTSKVGKAVDQAAYHALRDKLPATVFCGYEDEQAESQVLALLVDGKEVERIAEGTRAQIVVAQTPFYAESGGQVGDAGVIEHTAGRFAVSDTQRPIEGLVLHIGHVTHEALCVGDAVMLRVDAKRRQAIRRHHSATHLLHHALRTLLGPQAMQKGSRVGPERLRFDYAGSRPLSHDELRTLERHVGERILRNAAITTEQLPQSEAKARGAIGIFEERYGETVRMLRIADSLELCGGTHAARTGDIALFRIVSEGGLAAGVRRIEAVAGEAAWKACWQDQDELRAIGGILRADPRQATARLRHLVEHKKQLEREVERLQRELAEGSGTGQSLEDQAREVAGARRLGAVLPIGDAKTLRETADRLRDKLAPAAVLLGAATGEGKAILVCSVAKELSKTLPAGNLVRRAAEIVGGKGGGRPDFAQAGGPNTGKLAEAVATVYEEA